MKPLKLLYRYILLIFFSLITQWSEAKIIVKSVDCLGNLTVFDYNPGAGLTVSSIQWDFGDGYTSVNIKSNHIYKAKGFFTVKANVSLSNGGTQTDAVQIEIVGLPQAAFKYEYYSDSCFNQNFICFKDLSLPAVSGQTITKRILLWGDGGSDISNKPVLNDVLCHKYTSTGAYKATMEVTDKFGCKSITSFQYNIVGSVDALIGVSQKYIDCKTIALCYSNNSMVQQPAKVKYFWNFDTLAMDTNSYRSGQRCIYYGSSKSVKTTLKSVTNSGCTDSITTITNVSFTNVWDRLVLSDSVMCYGDGKTIKALGSNFTADLVEWELDNVPYYKTSNPTFSFNPKVNGIMPGKHLLTCKIKRGNCIVNLKINFVVKGPVARMGMINQYQCSTNRQVSVFDKSEFTDSLHTTYFWKFRDTLGDKCTTDYVRDYNLYSNCNYAIGKYHKHVFPALGSGYPVTLIVTDNQTGCKDSVSMSVNLLNCSKIFGQNSYTICQGDKFLSGFTGGTSDPLFFTIDSGKLWQPFPSLLQPPLLGYYNVGFIFVKYAIPWAENIGKDSFRIRQDTLVTYDTIYKYRFLNILETKRDSLSYSDFFKCGDNRVSVYFRNKKFFKGEKIEVDWGDGKKENISFNTATTLDSLHHRYTAAGVNGNIVIKLYNASGCFTPYVHKVSYGRDIKLKYLSPLCQNNTICLQTTVSDNSSGNNWSNFNNKNLRWVIDDSIVFTNVFSVCHRFSEAGLHFMKIIAGDSITCFDTFKGNFSLQEVHAVIKNTPKVLFCSELRQFFDSSYVLNKFDQISTYKWDFGGNTSTLKDPFISFNSSADSVTVWHMVQTPAGCKDTARLAILLVGGKPYFTIKDTIACGSLNALFFNKSKNCKSYIWEFGDDFKNTLDMNDTQYVRFNYTKPGRYHIKLKGIDTIYNPSTGNTYYCITEFPGKDSVRDVVVLPMIKNAIYSRDTICYGDSVKVMSNLNPDVVADRWDMGDGRKYYMNPPAAFYHLYPMPGFYRISCVPEIKPNLTSQFCVDSASKNITVLSVKADFDKDPGSYAPYTIFNNKSQPSNAMLNWDFGQPATGSLNTSTEQNPSVVIAIKFKPILVCLKASLPFGCSDTTCKPYSDNDSASIVLYNVFTPGNGDNKNDYYDIPIAGEDIYDLQIYNRWGVLVFEDETDREYMDPNNWNGTLFNKGAECPAGNYFYIFRYRIPVLSKETKIVNGVIQLIR